KEIESLVMHTPPPPLASQLPNFDPEIDSILARAMANDRNQRFPDATALGQAFNQYRSRLPSGDSIVARRQPTPPPSVVGGAMSRGDAAFLRAVGAYEEQAFEVARRFTIEALAEDPTHARAQELLARLDPDRPPAVVRPARTASPKPPLTMSKPLTPAPPPPAPPPPSRAYDNPEVVSTDPTLLISRASRSEPARQPAAMDETVL